MIKKILILEDQTGTNEMYKNFLERAGYEVVLFAEPLFSDESVEDLSGFDLIVSDFDAGSGNNFGETAVRIYDRCKELGKTPKVIGNSTGYLPQLKKMFTDRFGTDFDFSDVCGSTKYRPNELVSRVNSCLGVDSEISKVLA